MKKFLKENKHLFVIAFLAISTIILLWLPSKEFVDNFETPLKKKKKLHRISTNDREEELAEYEKEDDAVYDYHTKLESSYAELESLAQQCSDFSKSLFNGNPVFPRETKKLIKYFKILFNSSSIERFVDEERTFYDFAFNHPKGFKVNRATRFIAKRFDCEDFQYQLLNHALDLISSSSISEKERIVTLHYTLRSFTLFALSIEHTIELGEGASILKKVIDLQMLDKKFDYISIKLVDDMNDFVEGLDVDRAKFSPDVESSNELYWLLRSEYGNVMELAKKLELLVKSMLSDSIFKNGANLL